MKLRGLILKHSVPHISEKIFKQVLPKLWNIFARQSNLDKNKLTIKNTCEENQVIVPRYAQLSSIILLFALLKAPLAAT